MNLIKRIPISYTGELHDIRLVNFTVAVDEIKNEIPDEIVIRDFNGRAMISMVDVKLKNMRPTFAPRFCHFDYRHVAFRLLVNDSAYNQGMNKGIYFYKSFTNRKMIAAGGNLLTDYRLKSARIEECDDEVVIAQNKHIVKYRMNANVETTDDRHAGLHKNIAALDRAYSVLGKDVRVTQIQREKWPIQRASCTLFETSFFKTAKLEGAFRVHETIYYRWLPPRTIAL